MLSRYRIRAAATGALVGMFLSSGGAAAQRVTVQIRWQRVVAVAVEATLASVALIGLWCWCAPLGWTERDEHCDLAPMDTGTRLALDRTRLAYERTLMARVRTPRR